ncbi:MAG TPA: hypothetical protein VH592_03370 [Gemmataceae bacterium]|jgi:hypothetical protein
MRASSLSNAKVIELLNHYFIAVQADERFYKHQDSVPTEEKAKHQRIFQEFYRLDRENRQAGKPGLSVGTVHAYILTPEGKPFDSLHVAEAKPDRVIAMLQTAIDTLKIQNGPVVVEPEAQSTAPTAKPNSLVLHLTARYLAPRQQTNTRYVGDDEFVPMKPPLGTAKAHSWSAVPAEDWIALERTEWTKLLPAVRVGVGDSWELNREVSAQILKRFYPASENNDLNTNRIDQQALKATVVAIKDGIVQSRIEGSLKMKHDFYPGKPDDNFVDATILGYLDFEQEKPQIRTLKLATEKAVYGRQPQRFGVAVRSVTPSTD